MNCPLCGTPGIEKQYRGSYVPKPLVLEHYLQKISSNVWAGTGQAKTSNTKFTWDLRIAPDSYQPSFYRADKRLIGPWEAIFPTLFKHPVDALKALLEVFDVTYRPPADAPSAPPAEPAENVYEYTFDGNRVFATVRELVAYHIQTTQSIQAVNPAIMRGLVSVARVKPAPRSETVISFFDCLAILADIPVETSVGKLEK